MSWKLGEVVVIRECNDGKPRIGVVCNLSPCRVMLANPMKFILGEETFSMADIPCGIIRFKDLGIRERHILFPEFLDQDIWEKCGHFWFCFDSMWADSFLDKKKIRA